MRPRCTLGAVAFAAVMLGLAACSPDTETPVPEVASEPYECGKVPLQGVELMSGRDDLRGLGGNDLGNGIPSQCIFKDGEEFVLHVNVDDWPKTSSANPAGLTAPEDIRRRLAEGDADAVSPLTSEDVGVDGVGLVSGTPGESGGLWWACDDVIMVQFSLEKAAEGRDTVEDLTRYARSVLPAACEVPNL